MRKILTGIFILGISAAVVFGVTRAFFSDTETSKDNVLQAGALDLKIDNTCYYNGQACVPALGPDDQELGYSVWSDNPHRGNPEGERCTCTWKSKDLEPGDVFFDLHDLKPGDWEEDTISINVDNPSWLCADIKVTRDADNSCTEPEQAAVGGESGACVDPDGDGELAENLYFVFWKDDGDNVFEEGETEGILTEGTADNILGGAKWALADSSTRGGPIGPDTYYIGKFFCFGKIGLDPEPEGEGGPVGERGTGFTCDGKLVDNKPQTDSLEGDISFYAEQARHNEGFSCTGETPTPSASPTPPQACNNADVMLVLDRSGSIDSGELGTLKTAANSFVTTLALSPSGNHAGESSFADTGSLDQTLTDSSAAMNTAINALSSGGFTNLKEGIDFANTELASVRDRADGSSPDKMVIITDGNPNRPLPEGTADDVAKTSADTAKGAGVEIFVVGIGGDVNATYLTNDIASAGAGHYFSGANYTDLQTILDNLDLCD